MGTMRKMQMTETPFQAKLLFRNTWLIQGAGCNCYLLVGNKRGVLIDTGFATENLQVFAQSLTDKPVEIAANTHGHFAHTGGNGWFSHAYMSAKALEIAKIPYPRIANLGYPLDYLVTVVGDGDVIDLGFRYLEVIEIPAHSEGSIAFLDKREHILFTGDEVDDQVMLISKKDEKQPVVARHASAMEKLLSRKDDFDLICAGHTLVMSPAAIIADYLTHDQLIISKTLTGKEITGFDFPTDFELPQPAFKRASVYEDTTLLYDVRFIQDPVLQRQVTLQLEP